MFTQTLPIFSISSLSMMEGSLIIFGFLGRPRSMICISGKLKIKKKKGFINNSELEQKKSFP
jgi:hypothetical protein